MTSRTIRAHTRSSPAFVSLLSLDHTPAKRLAEAEDELSRRPTCEPIGRRAPSANGAMRISSQHLATPRRAVCVCVCVCVCGRSIAVDAARGRCKGTPRVSRRTLRVPRPHAAEQVPFHHSGFLTPASAGRGFRCRSRDSRQAASSNSGLRRWTPAERATQRLHHLPMARARSSAARYSAIAR
jgi:hypothetical protein